MAGEVSVWKAFRVAELTMLLPVEGALWVDTHLAPVAHSCSFAQIGRTVEAAIIRFDPDEAARRAAEAAEHRDVQVFLNSADATGTVDVTGRLDLADAVDLEQALQAGAAALAAARLESHGYEPSPRLREQVMLRDRSCVFPHCTRPARGRDLDHIVPWDQGGATASDNLACLCRRHHRAKTHSAWSYVMVEPGLFTWTTPTGRTRTVDRRRRP